MIQQSYMDSLDHLGLQLNEGFDFASSYLRAFLSPIYCAGDAHESFRDKQVRGMLLEIRKDDDFNHALEVFQSQIGHPVALLGQHALDGRDNTAEFYLPTVRQFRQ